MGILRVNSGSAAGLISLSLMSAIGWLCSGALPYEIAQISGQQGQTVSVASFIASAELLCFAIAVLVSERLCRKSDLRSTIMIAGVIAVIASLSGMTGANLPLLVASRLAFGASTGIIAACVNALGGRVPQPEKIFAYFLIALCPVLACVMMGVPWLDGLGVGKSLFLIEAVVIGVAILLAPFIPVLSWQDERARAGAFIPKGALLLLLGLAILYIAQAVVWSFAEEAGERIGVTGSHLGMIFTIGIFTMAPGAALVTRVTRWVGRVIPAIACYAAFILVCVLCYITASPLLFTIGIISFNGVAAVLLPIIQAILATRDPEGRAAALSIGAVNFGAAFGPLLGSFVRVDGDVKQVGFVAILFFAISALCIIGSVMSSASRQKLAGCHEEIANARLCED